MGHDRGDRRTRDAELTVKAAAGDRDAFDQLFRLWFTPVWDLACGVLRDEDLAADVAQETFLAAWHNLGSLRDPGSFGGWVLRIGRNRALNRLRAERRSAPCESETVAAIGDRADQRVGGRPGGPADQAERRERQELVWAAAAVLGERDWLLLDLHLRHGLTPAELAGELGVDPNNCHQILHRLRRRLGAAVGHYLLWQRRARACPALEAIAASHHHFDHAADRAVARHEARCSTCSAVVADLVRPEQLLATLPALVPAPEHLMTKAADGIRAGQGSSGGAQAPQPVDPGLVPDPPAGPDSVAPGGTPPRPGSRHRRRRPATIAVTAAVALAIPATALGLTNRGDPPGTALAATAAPASSAVPTSGPSSSDLAPTADIPGTDVAPATDPPDPSTEPAPTAPTAAIAPGPDTPPPGPSTPVGSATSDPPEPTIRPPGSTSGSPGSTTTGTTRSSTTTSTTRPTTTSTTRPTTTTSTSTSTSRGAAIRRPTPAPGPTDPTPVPPPAAPPSVDARITAGSGSCRTGSSWTVTWASDGTTSSLEVPGTRPQTFDGDGGSGRATFCAPGGLTLRLTATGDGGTTVATPILPA